MDFPVLARRFAAGLLALLTGAASAQFTVDFTSSQGTGISQSKVLIENIRVYFPVENPFQPGTFTTQEANFNVEFVFDPGSLHLIPNNLIQFGGDLNCGTANVTVLNALNGTAIANSVVIVGNRSATTDAQGKATFASLPQGFVSVTATASNFNPATQAAALGCNVTTPVTLALTPVGGTTGGLSAGQFRIVLTWGQDPADLDSHLTGPGDTRWHIYYSAKTAGGVCGLDVDDTSSYGPETVTCPLTGTSTSLTPGIYRYSVHHYSGSGTIGSSGAVVRLDLGSGMSYTYRPPAGGFAGSKDVWTVFELTVFANGTLGIAPVNTISNVPSAFNVQRPARAQYGKPEDPSLFLNLTK